MTWNSARICSYLPVRGNPGDLTLDNDLSGQSRRHTESETARVSTHIGNPPKLQSCRSHLRCFRHCHSPHLHLPLAFPFPTRSRPQACVCSPDSLSSSLGPPKILGYLARLACYSNHCDTLSLQPFSSIPNTLTYSFILATVSLVFAANLRPTGHTVPGRIVVRQQRSCCTVSLHISSSL